MRAVIVVAVLLAFGITVNNQFVEWDDHDLILQNPNLNPPTVDGLMNHWREPHRQMYIPVVYTAWWTLAKLTPHPNPIVFHIGNLLVHAASSLVVYEILLILCGQRWTACFGAMIFA